MLDGTQVATLTSAPFVASISGSSVTAFGKHNLTAVAIDDKNATTTVAVLFYVTPSDKVHWYKGINFGGPAVEFQGKQFEDGSDASKFSGSFKFVCM